MSSDSFDEEGYDGDDSVDHFNTTPIAFNNPLHDLNLFELSFLEAGNNYKPCIVDKTNHGRFTLLLEKDKGNPLLAQYH